MKGAGEKNKFILVLAFLTTSLLCGCMRGELDERLIVASIGIDKTEDHKVKLTMGLIDTRSVDQQEAKGVQIYTSIGDTIFDAARASIIKLGKQPIWPYIKVVILGPSVSKEDIEPFLDFLNRNNEVQPNPYILISKEEAENIVKAKVDFASVPAVVIEKQLDQQGSVSYIPAIKLHQFTEMMLTSDNVGYAAIIQTVKKDKKWIPKVQNTAVIKKAKWIGELDTMETRGLLWVRKEVKGGILVIPSINGAGKIGLEILDKTKVAIKPKLKHGNVQQISVIVKSTASIGEMLTQKTVLTSAKINEIEMLAEQEIKREILAAIGKAKDLKADIFGFGDAIHRKYPDFWKMHKKDWNTHFSDLPVKVDVEVDIRNLGLFNY